MATKRTLIGNIKGPKGDTGAQGPQGATGPGATIEVGTVSTTAYGNTAQVTNSGTATAAVLDFVIPQGKPGEQTTKMSGLTLDTVTASTADYPIPATGDTGSVAWGKVIKFFNDAKTAIASKINISDIVNNLTSTATNKPLSAAQGKALNDAITALNTALDGKIATATARTDKNGYCTFPYPTGFNNTNCVLVAITMMGLSSNRLENVTSNSIVYYASGVSASGLVSERTHTAYLLKLTT